MLKFAVSRVLTLLSASLIPVFAVSLLIWTLNLTSETSFAAIPAARLVPEVSGFGWLFPEGSLPENLGLYPSQNNIALEYFHSRFYVAFRNSRNHFASDEARIIVVSSEELPSRTRSIHWKLEQIVFMKTDLREPYFLITPSDQLVLSFFQGGVKTTKFEPQHIFRIAKAGSEADGDAWSAPEVWGDPHEIAWEMKERSGKFWMTSYIGNHYGTQKAGLDVRFKESTDGFHWTSLDPANPDGNVYHGGVSEVGFEFDDAGNLWGVGRNEDGDDTGFGAQLYFADKDHLGTWSALSKSDPKRYDSPRMFKHGSELYLVARRDTGKAFGLLDRHLPYLARKWISLARYSLRPKRTALYHINQTTHAVEWLMDLPSAGDNAFPSIVKMSDDRYLVANYTSPLKYTHWSWITGQVSPKGTQVYWLELNFAP
ncbi:MAG: hypothetical protein H7222_10065 [Methylotenera sp.]|nr:hypothetical protein [Oligoflexia bacterium]